MWVINILFNFVSNGARTLHDAARGTYTQDSESVREIREEMFGQEMSDAERVRQDWRMMGRDARAAVESYMSAHE